MMQSNLDLCTPSNVKNSTKRLACEAFFLLKMCCFNLLLQVRLATTYWTSTNYNHYKQLYEPPKSFPSRQLNVSGSYLAANESCPGRVVQRTQKKIQKQLVFVSPFFLFSHILVDMYIHIMYVLR